MSFAKDPQQFITRWLMSQNRDLKVCLILLILYYWISGFTFVNFEFVFFLQTMTDVVGNPEEERRSEFYWQPWTHEAVCRYFYSKLNQKRAELEQALGIRSN